MRYWLIVPAAGSGRRLAGAGMPKQYLQVAGRTLLEWACSAFANDQRCAGAVFALAPADMHWPAVRASLERRGLCGIIEAPGGAQRCHSVRQALQALQGRATLDDVVLVHDAARPCLQRADVDALLTAAAASADGALLATPLADTLKRAASAPDDTPNARPDSAAAGHDERTRRVAQTLPREQLWRALTPQAARYGQLCTALDQALAAGREPTDEAQALEWLGLRPTLVSGAASNLKVTTRDDLYVAQALLEARARATLGAGATPVSPASADFHGS